MMYKTAIFYENNIHLDWFILYFCIENDLLNPNTVDEYLTQKINSGYILSENESNILLLDDLSKEKVLNAIKKIPDLSKNFDENILIAKEKTKFAIISYLRKYENNLSILFEKIDNLYADLDYPEDMENFVSYMPINENISKNFQTHKDFELNILKNIDTFLGKKLTENILINVD